MVVVLLDHPSDESVGVLANSILASKGSPLSDSSKNNCDNPTPYESTVVITNEARNTPAITASPLSLPRHELSAARRNCSGASVTFRNIRFGKFSE